jgi:hypothetical protein
MAFRANLKKARGQAMSMEEKHAEEVAQGMVQCGFCGRKFNAHAAARHIPFCETKAKQLPRINTKKK